MGVRLDGVYPDRKRDRRTASSRIEVFNRMSRTVEFENAQVDVENRFGCCVVLPARCIQLYSLLPSLKGHLKDFIHQTFLETDIICDS